MPAVAPPFTAARSPHLDLEIRELYRRIGTIERILRTSAPSPAPTAVTVKTVSGKVVYCVRGTLYYDQGWGSFANLWRGHALYLLKLYPPSLILSVLAYLSKAFESNDGQEQSFGGFTLTDIEPHEVEQPDGPPLFPRSGRYWGAELEPDAQYPWVSHPIAIDLKVQHPSLASYWYNVRRYQPTGRESHGRDIPPLQKTFLPFTCGFVFGGTPALAETVEQGWPEGMQGAITFVAVWIDRLVPRKGPEVLIKETSVFAIKTVKVGPR